MTNTPTPDEALIADWLSGLRQERLELAAKTLDAFLNDPTNNRARDVREASASATRLADRLSALTSARREVSIEDVAKKLYELDPHYENGGSMDGFQVAPGGNLSWEQFCNQCNEFGCGIFHRWEDRRREIYATAHELFTLLSPRKESVEDVTQKADNIRAFAQDCLDQHPDRASIDNLMAIRDEATAILALFSPREARGEAGG